MFCSWPSTSPAFGQSRPAALRPSNLVPRVSRHARESVAACQNPRMPLRQRITLRKVVAAGSRNPRRFLYFFLPGVHQESSNRHARVSGTGAPRPKWQRPKKCSPSTWRQNPQYPEPRACHRPKLCPKYLRMVLFNQDLPKVASQVEAAFTADSPTRGTETKSKSSPTRRLGQHWAN